MKTTYRVVRRFFDRFSGLPLMPGYAIVASEAQRNVRFVNENGNDLTGELLPSTDADFAFVKGELDKLVAEGTLAVDKPAQPKPDAPKPVPVQEPAKAPEAPKAEPAKPEPAKADKKPGK